MIDNHPYIQQRKMVHREMNDLYTNQNEIVEKVLEDIDNLSPGLILTVCDSFAGRNRDYHGWMVDTIAKHITPSTISVLGSGVGLMLGLRLLHTFPKATITMIDYNPWIKMVNELVDLKKELRYVCADVIFDDITEYLQADLIINPSCDQMWPMNETIEQVANTYCMLSSNMEYMVGNRNCVYDIDGFIDQLQPKNVLYTGETYLNSSNDRMLLPNSKRFMVIGQSTQHG